MLTKPDYQLESEPDKILIVLHQEHSSPGRVGQMLVQKGYKLDIRRPRFGDPLPLNMEGHKAAIIFGGPMSANDPDDFVKKEIDWCGVPLRDDAPFLGICLGAQMMVKHLGGEVTPHPDGLVEVGYYPIRKAIDLCEPSILPDLPDYMYQWHSEGFTLPTGTKLLATGDTFHNQAFHVENSQSYGIQFHTELTYAMLCKWLVTGAHRMKSPGAQQRRQHLEGRLLYDKAVRHWLDVFLDNWLRSA